MNIDELSQDELNELKETYSEETATPMEEITIEELQEYYSMVSFVEEDFFCNL